MNELNERINELEEVAYELEAFYSILEAVDENCDMTLQEDMKRTVNGFMLMLKSIKKDFNESVENIRKCSIM